MVPPKSFMQSQMGASMLQPPGSNREEEKRLEVPLFRGSSVASSRAEFKEVEVIEEADPEDFGNQRNDRLSQFKKIKNQEELKSNDPEFSDLKNLPISVSPNVGPGPSQGAGR